MAAEAFNGGKIRPQVSIVKAIASAVCIGTGGSVGREGPIVQIGAALASTIGQRLGLAQHQLRILVACGAAGGIAATFNAPITGVFFGAEIILRAINAEALVSLMVSAMVADAVVVPVEGNDRFLAGFPQAASLGSERNFIFVVILAVLAAFVGQGFRFVLYKVEDICAKIWGTKRPAWLMPVVGGVLVGAVLLVLPEMYGVGYPVMYQALDGKYAIWFCLILMLGKVVSTSLCLGVGGSGGVFAPSLFTGVMLGMAYGLGLQALFGPGVGSPAVYAAVGMGGVFAASTRSPLTAMISVVEMTGVLGLSLPVIVTAGIATALSRAIAYPTIYTEKLLRRGQDLEAQA
jgi:CIC family chloride channel protein